MKKGFLKIRGENANPFLQGQLTCDVNDVNDTQNILGAHCNQKGRVLFNFELSFHQTYYLMKMPHEMLSIAKMRLDKFAIFSRVDIEITPETSTSSNENEIKKGLANIYPETSGLFTPHELNYPALGLVSFKKGCYIGQEIVARMEYLGKLKKQLRQKEVEQLTPPIRGQLLNDEDVVVVDYCEVSPQHYLMLIL